MKFLSQEELQGLSFKKKVQQEQEPNPVRVQLDSLEVGQIILVTKEEWTLKTPPSGLINTWFVKSKSGKVFSSRTLLDESGWVIARVE